MSRIKLELKKFFVETHYLGEQTDLKKLQDGMKKYKYLNRDHPLVLQILDEEYAVITKFGTVTFWNVKHGLIQQFRKEIMPFVKNIRQSYDYSDTVKVFVGCEDEKVTFEEVFLQEIDLEKIKMISYVSAQSVALDRYEEEIDERLEELGKVIENVKASGHTHVSQKNLLKQVGNILSVKQNAVSKLALFDKPDETWERQEIEKLYDKLRSEYDLRDRFGVLNEKISFLSENNTALLQFISSQKSNFLELIVIVLIIIEIFIFIPDRFVPILKDLFAALFAK